MSPMAMKGKYFRIDERTAEAFDDWCAERRWINQGALFEALLRYAMAASPETLLALLEGRASKSNASGTVSEKRKPAKPKRRSAKGRG